MITLMMVATLGCGGVACAGGNCYAGATAYTYTAPVANYGYTPTYNYAANTVVTKFIAVKPYPEYVAVSGDYVRAPQNNDQINKLTGMVEALMRVNQRPQQQYQQQYAQSSPQQYGQPSPQQASPQQYAQPSPQYGEAAPPPLLPSKGLPSKGLPSKELPYAQTPDKSSPGQDSYSLIGGEQYGSNGNVPGPGASQGQFPSGLNSCMQCHTAGSARGGVTLFAAGGTPVPMTPELARRVDDSIREGRMPKQPNPPLNVLQYSEVRDWLESQAQPALNTASR